MCLFKKEIEYEFCSFCDNLIDEENPYFFKVIGLGKYNNKYICIDCILDKLLK